MSRQHIEIRQSFNAPIETIFNILTDHESFGNVIATKVQRVVDSQEENKNGVGSVRRVFSFPVPAFEETVITFKPNAWIKPFNFSAYMDRMLFKPLGMDQ